jgi:hypothetical protein
MASSQFNNSLHPTLLQVTNSQRLNVSDLAASGSRTRRSELGVDFQPSLFSVICGRGKDSYDHVGNQHFRELASMFVARYARAGSKVEKSEIVSEMVGMIHQADGTFCKYEKGTWFQVGDQCAREKASALLRGMLYKSRSFAKAKAQAKLFCRKTTEEMESNTTTTTSQQYGQQELVDGIDPSDDPSLSSSLSCWGISMDTLLDEDENHSLEDEDDFFDVFLMDSTLLLQATRLTPLTTAECTPVYSTS